MIIWSRWGILVVVLAALGAGTGSILGAIFTPSDLTKDESQRWVGIGLIIAGAYVWLFTKYVLGRFLDKPRPVTIAQALPEPVRLENGAMSNTRIVPVLHPETGEPLWTKPSSSLFFIPFVAWTFILPIIGLIIALTSL